MLFWMLYVRFAHLWQVLGSLFSRWVQIWSLCALVLFAMMEGSYLQAPLDFLLNRCLEVLVCLLHCLHIGPEFIGAVSRPGPYCLGLALKA